MFRRFFDAADMIYRFLEEPDFAELFETDIGFCNCFIELNLYMVAAHKEIQFELDSNRSVSVFMKGKIMRLYSQPAKVLRVS